MSPNAVPSSQHNQYIYLADLRKLGQNKQLHPEPRRATAVGHLRIPTQVFLEGIGAQIMPQLRGRAEQTDQ